jgi:hypothetical protein
MLNPTKIAFKTEGNITFQINKSGKKIITINFQIKDYFLNSGKPKGPAGDMELQERMKDVNKYITVIHTNNDANTVGFVTYVKETHMTVTPQRSQRLDVTQVL